MSTKDCKALEENLVGLIEDTLPAELGEELQAHLTGCPRCERLAGEFSAMWNALGIRAQTDPPLPLWPSVEQRLEARKAHPFLEGAILSRFVELLRPAAASLAGLLAVLAGLQLAGPAGESGSFPRPAELAAELKAEAYTSLYLEPFADIPAGSLADFYLSPESPEEDESP